MNAVAQALGNALETISGLRVYDYVSDAVSFPAALIDFPEVEYDANNDGAAIVTWDIHIVHSRAHDRSAYLAVTPYLLTTGTYSVKAKLENDLTLGTVSSVRVKSARVIPFKVMGLDTISATFIVETYGEFTG